MTPLRAIALHEDKVAGTTDARKGARMPKKADGKRTTARASAKKAAAKKKATGGRRAG
ncbi:hypothetical protein [Streptomyces sp. NRRL F-5755]|uniref:hypothetical protein n=1 Tax=Streptomyces sp. NRRL F-5755 TaxID=1519475 RepID=UPI000AF6B5C6|nr:hypothetical protein [Streptomyces sp. NRRL F-5755]